MTNTIVKGTITEYMSAIFDDKTNIMWLGYCKLNSRKITASYNCGIRFEQKELLSWIREFFRKLLSSDSLYIKKIFVGIMPNKIQTVIEECCQLLNVEFKHVSNSEIPSSFEDNAIKVFTKSFGEDMNKLNKNEKQVMAILSKEIEKEIDE